MPVLPFLTDSEKELDEAISAVKKYGADYIFIGGLTLFGKGDADSKTLYYKFLSKNHPDLIPKYISLYRIFFAPPKEYQNNLYKTSQRLCEAHGIKNSIID